MRPLCRHCKNPDHVVNRPRGLCWRCFHTPGVKNKYQSTSKYARQGVGNVPATVTPEPTPARPGSPEKLAVLEQRAERGEHLFHPLDGRC